MLINVRVSELKNNTTNSIPLSIIIIGSLNYFLFELLPFSVAYIKNYLFSLIVTLDSDIYYESSVNSNDIVSQLVKIVFVTSKTWEGSLVNSSHIVSIGNIMYTNYNIWLLIASLILLLALIGAIVITMKPSSN